MTPSASRAISVLSERIHQRLDAYALAATTAGVGLLALVQPAEAKIIYTPTHRNLVLGRPFPLDLNHDGVVDFNLLNGSTAYDHFLEACEFVSNYKGPYACRFVSGVNLVRASGEFAPALRCGKKIGSRNFFAKGAVLGALNNDSQWFGPWVNGGKGVKNRYLGLKFEINGRFHFGWARITVTTNGGFTATLTGYAYETIRGKGIVAGQTKGPASAARGNTSLGVLAAGAQGLPIWRRP